MTDISQRIANLPPEKRALLEQMLLQQFQQKDASEDGHLALVPRRTNEPPPLSFAQQRLWFLHQLEPESVQFNTARAIHIRNALNVAGLHWALEQIVERHEAIRTVFTTVAGEPQQHILSEWSVELPVIDLIDVSSEKKAAQIQHYFQAEAQRPFDLSRDLMMRVTLLQHSPTDHTLIMVKHHIASDAWSAGLFNRELATLYNAYVSKETAMLPPLSIQYADYAIWQRRCLAEGGLAQQIAYWQQKLANSPPQLALPADRPRPTMPSYRGAEQIVLFSSHLRDAVKALARQAEATPFMVLVAAFQLLLGRLSGQKDVLLGTPVAGRTRTETENLIGFFLNNLVLRTDLSGNPSFLALLRQVRQMALAAYANQDVPFEKVVEELHLERDMSRQPLFQVMFIMQNGSPPTLELDGLTLERWPSHNGTSPYDMTVAVTELPQGFRVNVEYATDLFDGQKIARWIGHYENLLKTVTSNAQQPIDQICLLTAEELARQHQWNSTDKTFPMDRSLVQLFASQTEQTPDRVAFLCGAEQLTYAELHRQSNQVAHYLRAQGVEVETTVGICLHRSLPMVVGLLGILKAGAAWLPLDPAYPAERLAFMLADAEVEVILTQRSLTATLPSSHLQKAICLDDLATELAHFPDTDLAIPILPDSLAYLIYTSGSTGRPKGVAVPHRQILNRLHWMWTDYPFAPDEVGCQKTALSFVDAIWEIFGPLLQGIPTVILPDDVVKEPQRMVEALARHAVTRLWFVPTFLRLLLETVPDLQAKLPKLNFWVTSGEPIGWELYEAFKTRLHRAEMYNLYGTSEVWDVTWYVPDAAHSHLPFMPIGKPIANMQTLILDDAGQPAPVGVVGELCVGGVGLALGYLNRPGLTAEKFIPHPMSDEPGARLYRTGDLACFLPNGQIAFIGRQDHQVKIRGYRVECGEVEAALLRLPGVQNCAVVTQEQPCSPGEQQLVAFVEPEMSVTLDTATLRQQLRVSLPEFMIPTLFQHLTSLPLTPSGKINRRSLPQVDATTNDSPSETVAPRTPVEAQLVSLWQAVLQRQPIGVTDNFFDLGGHSLLAVRLFARLNKQFNTTIPLAVLFTAPTIAALAKRIMEPEEQASWSSLVPIQPVGEKRPFFFVHGGAGQVFHFQELAEALGTERPFFGLQPQGWEQHRVEVPTVAQLAATYLAEIRDIQPAGPYHLGGYCFGGLVAFEIARQLQTAGETVATLAIIDPSPIKRIPHQNALAQESQTRWQRHLRALSQRTTGEKLYYLANSAHHRLQTVLKYVRGTFGLDNMKRLTFRLYLLSGQPVPEKWRDFYLMELVSRSAGRSYMPDGRFQGKIALFLAARAVNTWPLAATDGADIEHFPTDHLSILKQPHIQTIAQKVHSHLAQ